MKADWARYAEAGEIRTAEQADKTLLIAVNKASGLFVPDGCIRHFQPTLRHQPNRSPMNETETNPKTDGGRQAIQMAIRVDKCDHRIGMLCLLWLIKGLSILVSFSLQRLNSILDRCTYVHG